MEWRSLSLLVFVKLGGSIITDKRREATPRGEMIARLGDEIRSALRACPDLRVVLGHGSGSFGHMVGERYRVHKGIADDGAWQGYAETGAAAARLNRIVVDALLGLGLPVVSVQPSASARCSGGRLVSMATYPIREALRRGLVPLVYGDVAFDDVWGCAIVSTESVLAYLAHEMRPERIVLVGEVDGVYDRDPLQDERARRIPTITPDAYDVIRMRLGESHGVDVTGGMLSKVSEMVSLVAQGVSGRGYLVSGRRKGALEHALLGHSAAGGTVILPDERLADEGV